MIVCKLLVLDSNVGYKIIVQTRDHYHSSMKKSDLKEKND